MQILQTSQCSSSTNLLMLLCILPTLHSGNIVYRTHLPECLATAAFCCSFFEKPVNQERVLNACSMVHDDDFMELQQQFAEAKCVIKQLAAQLDHYSNIQQQLAGLHTFPLCFTSCVLHVCSSPARALSLFACPIPVCIPIWSCKH